MSSMDNNVTKPATENSEDFSNSDLNDDSLFSEFLNHTDTSEDDSLFGDKAAGHEQSEVVTEHVLSGRLSFQDSAALVAAWDAVEEDESGWPTDNGLAVLRRRHRLVRTRMSPDDPTRVHWEENKSLFLDENTPEGSTTSLYSPSNNKRKRDADEDTAEQNSGESSQPQEKRPRVEVTEELPSGSDFDEAAFEALLRNELGLPVGTTFGASMATYEPTIKRKRSLESAEARDGNDGQTNPHQQKRQRIDAVEATNKTIPVSEPLVSEQEIEDFEQFLANFAEDEGLDMNPDLNIPIPIPALPQTLSFPQTLPFLQTPHGQQAPIQRAAPVAPAVPPAQNLPAPVPGKIREMRRGRPIEITGNVEINEKRRITRERQRATRRKQRERIAAGQPAKKQGRAAKTQAEAQPATMAPVTPQVPINPVTINLISPDSASTVRGLNAFGTSPSPHLGSPLVNNPAMSSQQLNLPQVSYAPGLNDNVSYSQAPFLGYGPHSSLVTGYPQAPQVPHHVPAPPSSGQERRNSGRVAPLPSGPNRHDSAGGVLRIYDNPQRPHYGGTLITDDETDQNIQHGPRDSRSRPANQAYGVVYNQASTSQAQSLPQRAYQGLPQMVYAGSYASQQQGSFQGQRRTQAQNSAYQPTPYVQAPQAQAGYQYQGVYAQYQQSYQAQQLHQAQRYQVAQQQYQQTRYQNQLLAHYQQQQYVPMYYPVGTTVQAQVDQPGYGDGAPVAVTGQVASPQRRSRVREPSGLQGQSGQQR